MVDGLNVKDYTQEFLHNKIGYVSQKAVIFSDTVENNIAYGDNAEIIIEALQSDILSEHIIFGKNFSPNFLVPPYRIQMKRKGCDLTLSTYE